MYSEVKPRIVEQEQKRVEKNNNNDNMETKTVFRLE